MRSVSMTATEKHHLQELLGLFNQVGKRDVDKYCRQLIIRSEALNSLLLASQVSGLPPYAYSNRFDELLPESALPSTEDREALARNGVGPLTKEARKAVRKISYIFEVRRLIGVHLFFTANLKYWHMIYFDQRDYSKSENHWKHGPHVHYSQDTFTRDPLKKVWRKVHLPRPEFPKAVHIRYDYHHNRGKP